MLGLEEDFPDADFQWKKEEQRILGAKSLIGIL